jgi:hypothetical protein
MSKSAPALRNAIRDLIDTTFATFTARYTLEEDFYEDATLLNYDFFGNFAASLAVQIEDAATGLGFEDVLMKECILDHTMWLAEKYMLEEVCEVDIDAILVKHAFFDELPGTLEDVCMEQYND